jgi:hypothetical protein
MSITHLFFGNILKAKRSDKTSYYILSLLVDTPNYIIQTQHVHDGLEMLSSVLFVKDIENLIKARMVTDYWTEISDYKSQRVVNITYKGLWMVYLRKKKYA